MQPYEVHFARLFGNDYYAFGFWKARVALYAILKALTLRPGDEVISPAYTCVVVPNSIRYTGATPVYADIAPGNYNVDPMSVERKITPRTRIVLAQHTYGIPADVETLQAVTEPRGLILIEDCAHVLLGSTYRGKPMGSLGRAAFFSSQWSKPYTTGLGGMALTRDPELARRLKEIQSEIQPPPRSKVLQLRLQYGLFRRFFRPQLYWRSQAFLHKLSRLGLFVGSSNLTELSGEKPTDFDWNMSAFQYRAGLAQLIKLEENSAHRKNLTRYYLASLRDRHWPIENLPSDGATLLRVPVAVQRKDELLDQARSAGIELGSWFETPLHPLPLAQHTAINYMPGDCPVAESAARHVVNLPLHERVKHDDAEQVIQFILSHASPHALAMN